MKSLKTAQRGDTTPQGSSRGSIRLPVQTQLTGQHHAKHCPAPPAHLGAGAEAPPWPAPEACLAPQQRDKAEWRGQGPGPGCSTFCVALLWCKHSSKRPYFRNQTQHQTKCFSVSLLEPSSIHLQPDFYTV